VKTPRVRFFIWSTAKGKILTTDNLRRRGFTFITPGVLCATQLGRTLIIYFLFFALYCCRWAMGFYVNSNGSSLDDA